MSIFVVGPNEGEQSGGGPIRCRIIEDGSHTEVCLTSPRKSGRK